MTPHQITKAWFKRARQSLQVADVLMKSDRDFSEVCFFHCQEAARASVKGFLTFHEVRLIGRPSLENLSRLVASVDSELSAILSPMDHLIRLGEGFDYESVGGRNIVPEEVDIGLTVARLIYEEALSRVPFESLWAR